MGKTSHKSKHREEPVEDEEFVIPKWVAQFVARITKVYAKQLVTKFLRMKINTIEVEVQKLLEELAPLDEAEREKQFELMLEESKPARAKKAKTARDPKEPKKFQSAYFLWSATFKKADIDRDYPEYAEKIKNKEMAPSKVRGLIWSKLPEAERDKFNKLCDEGKERYFTEMKIFNPDFVRPAPSRAGSRAPSRANSPEPPAKSRKNPASRDDSPKRKSTKKKTDEEPPAKKKTEEEPPAKKTKKVEAPKPAPKKKPAASKRKLPSSSSSSDSSSVDQSEGPSQWADD